MRLTKGQLKRIIREEYSRLKRRGLVKESRRTRRFGRRGRLLRESHWQMNPAMGGPEDQPFPEGTSIDQAAQETVDYILSDYGPEVVTAIAQSCRIGRGLQSADGDEDMEYAISDALESMDVDGSGNYEYSAAEQALVAAFSNYAV